MAELALVGITLAWGTSFTVAKAALVELAPLALLALRFAVGFLALVAIRPSLLGAGGHTLRVGLGLGGILWLAFALQTTGLTGTTPAKSAFLTGCAVLMVPPLERLLLGRRMPLTVALGVLTAVVGLYLLLHPTSLADLNRGDLVTLGGALAFALHVVLLGRYASGHSSRALAAYQILCVALLAVLFSVADGAVLAPAALSSSTLAGVLFLGLVCTALTIQVQTWAQQRTSPTRAALIFALEPVSAAAVSVVWAGERLSPGEWLGGAILVGGVMLGSLGRARTLPTSS